MVDESNPNGVMDIVSNWTRACVAYELSRDLDLEAFRFGPSAKLEPAKRMVLARGVDANHLEKAA